MSFDLKSFMSTTTVPSRRQNKNRSGRAGRKQHNGHLTVAAVGGYSSDLKAIFAGEGKELCKVVPMSTGMRDGVPFRSPGLHR